MSNLHISISKLCFKSSHLRRRKGAPLMMSDLFGSVKWLKWYMCFYKKKTRIYGILSFPASSEQDCKWIVNRQIRTIVYNLWLFTSMFKIHSITSCLSWKFLLKHDEFVSKVLIFRPVSKIMLIFYWLTLKSSTQSHALF